MLKAPEFKRNAFNVCKNGNEMKCLQSTRGNKAKALVNEIKCVMTGERRNRVKTREKNREIISAARIHERFGSWIL